MGSGRVFLTLLGGGLVHFRARTVLYVLVRPSPGPGLGEWEAKRGEGGDGKTSLVVGATGAIGVVGFVSWSAGVQGSRAWVSGDASRILTASCANCGPTATLMLRVTGR
jgi:hypothetical protein